MTTSIKEIAEEIREDQKRPKIVFLPNGNTMVFRDGQQAPELQEAWLLLYCYWLATKGENPREFKIILPDGAEAEFLAKSFTDDLPDEPNWEIKKRGAGGFSVETRSLDGGRKKYVVVIASHPSAEEHLFDLLGNPGDKVYGELQLADGYGEFYVRLESAAQHGANQYGGYQFNEETARDAIKEWLDDMCRQKRLHLKSTSLSDRPLEQRHIALLAKKIGESQQVLRKPRQEGPREGGIDV